MERRWITKKEAFEHWPEKKEDWQKIADYHEQEIKRSCLNIIEILKKGLPKDDSL